jgi:hypothetical protein
MSKKQTKHKQQVRQARKTDQKSTTNKIVLSIIETNKIHNRNKETNKLHKQEESEE